MGVPGGLALRPGAGLYPFRYRRRLCRRSCEELLGQAIRAAGLPRETLFITTKVSPEHLAYEDVLRSCENSLRRLGMEYIDLYLIHWPRAGMKLEETFRALNQLVRQGKLRYLGVSNFDLKQLKRAAALSETPLLTNQVPYSIPDRTYARKRGAGILPAKRNPADGLHPGQAPHGRQQPGAARDCQGPSARPTRWYHRARLRWPG